MNEEEKQTKSMPLWLMIVLIVVLVLAVKMMFSFVEIVGPEKPKNPYEVIDVTSGVPSAWKLDIAPAAADSPAAAWMDEVEKDGSCHTFIEVTPDSWGAYVYLPEVEQALANENVSMEIEKKDDGKSRVLNVYVSTVALEKEGDPQEQLLHFVPPENEQWPNDVRVILNGAKLEQDSRCILNAGEMFWRMAEE